MAPMTRNWQWTGAAALFALLGLTLVIYWPGLAGPLILDDIPESEPPPPDGADQ
jgi:hypothetical protein